MRSRRWCPQETPPRRRWRGPRKRNNFMGRCRWNRRAGWAWKFTTERAYLKATEYDTPPKLRESKKSAPPPGQVTLCKKNARVSHPELYLKAAPRAMLRKAPPLQKPQGWATQLQRQSLTSKAKPNFKSKT